MTTTLPRALAVGDRPRTSALALLAAVATAVAAVALRLLSPTALLGVEPAVATAAVGGSLAAAVGRYRGGVLAAVLAAAIPVFAVDAATYAVREPLALELVARAAAAAAWYTTGVAVLLVGPFGYALGALSRPAPDAAAGQRSDHRAADRPQVTVLAAWAVVAFAATAAATVRPTATPLSPAAAAPLPAATGLVVAADLGRRAPRPAAPAIAGWIGVTTGLHLFTRSFVVAGPTTTLPSPAALALVTGLGALAGIPLGLTGHVIGRTLAD